MSQTEDPKIRISDALKEISELILKLERDHEQGKKLHLSTLMSASLLVKSMKESLESLQFYQDAERESAQLSALMLSVDLVRQAVKNLEEMADESEIPEGYRLESMFENILALFSGRIPDAEKDKRNSISVLKDVWNIVEDVFVGHDDYAQLREGIQSGRVSCTLMQQETRINCHLHDYFDQTMIFQHFLSDYSLVGKMNVEIKAHYLGEITFLRVEGDVSEVNDEFITLEFATQQLSDVTDFMKVFQTRQNNVNLFMKYAKGIA